LRPPAVGVGEALDAVAEKICLAAGEREQALLRRRVGFDRAVGSDMAERQSARGQRPADQQAAMAVERLALGAEQAHAMVRHFIHHASESGREFRRGGDALVVGDAVAVEARIARAAAQRIPQRDIGDRLARESLRQCLAREPGSPAREWHRAHVGDSGDTGVLEQGHEAIGRQIGVADGQELAGGGSRHGLGRVLTVSVCV